MIHDSLSSGARHAGSEAHPEEVRELLAEAKASSAALWTGVYLGAALNIVMIAALVAANRFPNSESYALERNAASFGLFVLLLLIPVIRFPGRPAKMFAAGFVGWVLFIAGYRIAGFYFNNLFQVLRTPLEGLVEGCVLYGVAAVGFWVAGMIFQVRKHSIATRRSAAQPTVNQRP
jgi:ABC-type enterochelin transport system permease subunit